MCTSMHLISTPVVNVCVCRGGGGGNRGIEVIEGREPFDFTALLIIFLLLIIIICCYCYYYWQRWEYVVIC